MESSRFVPVRNSSGNPKLCNCDCIARLNFDAEYHANHIADSERYDRDTEAQTGHLEEPFFKRIILGNRDVVVEHKDDKYGDCDGCQEAYEMR